MKIAFIADVHSNLEAFEAVLTFLEKKEVNRVYVAGDLIGYYYYASEVINICMSREEITCIRGNHDRNFVDALSDERLMEELTAKYGSSYQRARRQLTEEQVEWLRRLPKTISFRADGISITIAHGSVENEDTYIYPDSSPEILADQLLGSDITVLGHTHHPFMWAKDDKYLLNPGSVGQPRDQGSMASIFVLDTSNRAIVPYKVKFSAPRLKHDILEFDPDNEYLLRVLEKQ